MDSNNIPSSIDIIEELKKSHLSYAMSVIVGRALPDVRDGLKPVHRRIIYSMSEGSFYWNKAYKKSARVVGDVIGKYHPHGDTAIYDSLVRMAQDFSMRYPLVDGQGNFGSIDGDSPAAMRYTEVRMEKITNELIADLDKNTVDFVPNYDGTEWMPDVLPTKIPNLLINGSIGIAVGMATNIPPHNLTEVLNACIALLKSPEISIEDLIDFIKGPDFPTSAQISGLNGIKKAYLTGSGKIKITSKYHFEQIKNRDKIVIDELPYQVNKSRLIEQIAELVKAKKIEGISELRDESNKKGIRIVIELKRNEIPEVVINQLLFNTRLKVSFGMNFVALADGKPSLLNLKQILTNFIKHRRDVVSRKSLFELKKSQEQIHLLEGLIIATSPDNLDKVIDTIRNSKDVKEARDQLLKNSWNLRNKDSIIKLNQLLLEINNKELKQVTDYYNFTSEQVKSILDLRLQKLIGMEQEKLLADYNSLLDKISYLIELLSDPDKLTSLLVEELEEIKKNYGDERKTEIVADTDDFDIKDLVADEELVITITRDGYIKSQAIDSFKTQKRGGIGRKGSDLKDEDIVEQMISTTTHNTILCFTDSGKVHWLEAYKIPKVGTNSRGRAVINLLKLKDNEKITSMLAMNDNDLAKEELKSNFVLMATAGGVVKKLALKHFTKSRNGGIIAIKIDQDDKLQEAKIVKNNQTAMLFSTVGKANRFLIKDIRETGRTSRGVRGIRLTKNAKVISMLTPSETDTILTVSKKGYGKATTQNSYPIKNRGGVGMISMNVKLKQDEVINAKILEENTDDILLVTNLGQVIRIPAKEISLQGRNTRGSKLIQLRKNDYIVDVSLTKETDKSIEEDVSKPLL